jgi:hypothetical protein
MPTSRPARERGRRRQGREAARQHKGARESAWGSCEGEQGRPTGAKLRGARESTGWKLRAWESTSGKLRARDSVGTRLRSIRDAMVVFAK